MFQPPLGWHFGLCTLSNSNNPSYFNTYIVRIQHLAIRIPKEDPNEAPLIGVWPRGLKGHLSDYTVMLGPPIVCLLPKRHMVNQFLPHDLPILTQSIKSYLHMFLSSNMVYLQIYNHHLSHLTMTTTSLFSCRLPKHCFNSFSLTSCSIQMNQYKNTKRINNFMVYYTIYGRIIISSLL